MGGIAEAYGDANFRRYSVGAVVSWLSFFVQAVAVSWTAWSLTHSTGWLAAVALLDAVPMSVLAPFGGVVAGLRLRDPAIRPAGRAGLLGRADDQPAGRPRPPARPDPRFQRSGPVRSPATFRRPQPAAVGHRGRFCVFGARLLRRPGAGRMGHRAIRRRRRLREQRRGLRHLFLVRGPSRDAGRLRTARAANPLDQG